MKKYFQDIVGTFIGGISGWIGSGIYNDWIQPMIMAAVCAFIGLVVTHYGKKLFKWLERPGELKAERFKQNGRK